MENQRFPNLFLTGAPKAGTTSLFEALGRHNQIFAPLEKEPRFLFNNGEPARHMMHSVEPSIRSEAEYLAIFEQSDRERYLLDGSTQYLSSMGVPQRIFDRSPDAKIICVLREPISRAFSHYLMGVRDGFIRGSLEEAITREDYEIRNVDILWEEHYRIIRRSLYWAGINDYLKYFPTRNIRVYLYEDLAKNVNWLLEDLAAFLELEVGALDASYLNVRKNRFARDKFPIITSVFARYKQSKVRYIVRRSTPGLLRAAARRRFNKARLEYTAKPELKKRDIDLIKDRVGADYKHSIELSADANILRRPVCS